MPDLAVAELSIPAEQNPDPHPLSSVLEYTIGREEAAKYSWHSFRIGLACALRAAGCPPDVVQLICRWMCAESLRIYSLKGISEHAHWISRGGWHCFLVACLLVLARASPRDSNSEFFLPH